MSISKVYIGYFIVAALMIVGCATSNVSVTSGIAPITRDEVEDRPVELPGGYDVDNFRRLRLMVTGGEIDSNSGALKKQAKHMSTRFQSEMAKHKRFDINAVHGVNVANQTLNNMIDQGLVATDDDLDEGEEDDAKYGQMPDLKLQWTMNIQEQVESTGSLSQMFKWLCTVNVTAAWNRDIKDSTGKIKYRKNDVAMTGDFDLPIIEKEQVLTRLGAVKKGFSYRRDADVQGLMQEIVVAASQRIADDLGRQFPVGGRITGAIGTEMMMMDQGVDQGVEKAMEMVIFARYDGVDVPLANATASPSKDKSQLEIWRFAKSKTAKMLWKQIGDNPRRWMKENDAQLYCVRAVPPQDNTKGTRFE